MILSLKLKHFISFLLVMSILVQYGCTEDAVILSQRKAIAPGDILEPHVWDCHHEEEWTKQKIATTLVGKWTWDSGVCPEYNEQNQHLVEENLMLHFQGEDILEVIRNEEVIQTTNWRIEERLDDTYAVRIRPTIATIAGRVLFCKEQMIFNGSYNSRCDNYFKRVE